MRRPVRPFTVERKRGARPAPVADTPLLETPTPMAMPEPARQWAPEPTRWAAAEALFSIPPADAPEPVFAEPTNLGRILPSLDEPAAPAYEFEAAPKRRGRKLGSRNKTSRATREGHGPKTLQTVMRNVFEFWVRDEEAEARAPEAEAAQISAGHDVKAAHMPSPSAPEFFSAGAVLTRGALNRRGRLVRGDLPRALRWQARLPRFAR
ncbi:MAG: hypothetical protein Q8M31_11655 [Beijerinckiaceae bacterium]|nr:hypothetical protein [Beijerinckiaceae bacterium]